LSNNRPGQKKQKLSQKSPDDCPEAKVLKLFRSSNENLEDLTLIDGALTKQFFMRSLDKKARIEVVKQMALYIVKPDTVLFNQGSLGNFFYIIKEGSVELTINDKVVKKLLKGESFGELALLHEAPRSGSVRSLEETYVYCLERRGFRNIINGLNELNFEENKKFVESIAILCN
jgi:CRP-like cAMP-binding protein